MKMSRLLSLILALCMLFTLTACKPDTEDTAKPSPSQSAPSPAPSQSAEPGKPESPAPSQSAEPARSELHFTVLSGPTGVGAAKLLSDVDAGDAPYEYSIAAVNDEVTAMLANGETDLAAVASNVALNLYNKTNGAVTCIALGTLGVLHILESGGGTSIQSVKDLAGKTILAPGQGANPEYILRYVLSENGLDPESDVELEFYTDASQITAKLLSGEAECAMLPVPAATAAIAKSGGSVRAALDLTEEWNALGTGGQLVMTAVVARTEFLNENPDAVDAFLSDYAASIEYVKANVQECGELIAGYGIAPSAAIAAKAIPQCNLVCITGSEMAPTIDGYYSALYDANPKSIGGSLPDDAFYYVP